MSFQGYERYKDSGVDWLREVPHHWRSAKLKWLSRRYSGGTPDKTRPEYWEHGNIPWLSSGEVNQSLIVNPSAFISEEGFANSSAKWIPAGALVVALAGQGKTKGTVAQVSFRATCNQSMAAIIPHDESQVRFLFWWLASNYQNIRNLAGGDLRDGLNLELIGDIDCPVVSQSEALCISRFLDRETAKIDALIEEQRRLIALLQELRQAVISHAVTKGLDPSVPMKDSGVEWLQTVPQHWEVKRLRNLANVENGFDYKSVEVTEGGYPVYGSGGEFARAEQPLFSGPSVLLGRKGTIDRPLFVDVPFWTVDTSFYTVISSNTFPRFFYYFCLILPFPMYANGTALPSMTQAILYDIPALVVPLEEQRAIAAFLDHETAKIDFLIEQQERLITLLQERRSALISATVTGKIDVRSYTTREAASEELDDAA